MKRKEQVLFYQFRDAAKLELARSVLRRMGIATKILPENAWREKVGYLLGAGGFKASSAKDDGEFSFPHGGMILQNIGNKRLDGARRALREAGVPPIPFKSVVTPFNTLWTLRRLCETMQKEHAFMLRQGEKGQEAEQ